MITFNQECIDLIKAFESCSLEPYHGQADRPEIFTIGYGTIKYPDYYMGGKLVALSDPSITKERAVEFLMTEVKRVAAAIDVWLRDDITPNQCGALVSFAYNLGDMALKNSTLRKKVNNSPLDPTIKDEFLKWVHSDGKVWPGLVRRRQAEADLYFKA
jgi:lysozyme